MRSVILTSGQSNLTQDRIAAAHERFGRTRQVAPMCTSSSTPQSASASYRFCPPVSHLEYVDRRTCPGMSWSSRFWSSKLPLHVWGSRPPSNTWFLGPTRLHICHGISIVQHLAQITAKALYFTMGRPFPP